ncbi:transmembrane protein, putative [Medicago truncatula]|uniref:Transmembrane protein, putative n=2 Tax=Medicago truncatula TaxID=3880 RepID=A0A072UUN8_MEDTR|nr:transmembrane protein, putative [Medicago truncatula]
MDLNNSICFIYDFELTTTTTRPSSSTINLEQNSNPDLLLEATHASFTNFFSSSELHQLLLFNVNVPFNHSFYRPHQATKEQKGVELDIPRKTTQKVDSRMMEIDDELDGVLADQVLKFDAMKKELEGKLAEMKKLMEEEIETVKKESEMEISNMNKILEAQVHLADEENKENLLEVKKNVDVEIASFKKIAMEELFLVKESLDDEVSLLKEELGWSNSSLWKLKLVVLMMMFMLGWLAFLKS